MRTQRLIALLLALLLCGALFSACGEKKEESTVPTEPSVLSSAASGTAAGTTEAPETEPAGTEQASGTETTEAPAATGAQTPAETEKQGQTPVTTQPAATQPAPTKPAPSQHDDPESAEDLEDPEVSLEDDSSEDLP